MSTSIFRTLKNIYKSGLKRSAWQIQHHNDTKSGWLVGIDDFGNKFYETDAPDEIHLRTRWVEYNQWNQDMSQVEPGWHYWLGYGTNTPPNALTGDEKQLEHILYLLNINQTLLILQVLMFVIILLNLNVSHGHLKLKKEFKEREKLTLKVETISTEVDAFIYI